MPKKKILHIQLLPLLSGVQNMMLSLLEGLDEQEFEIHVACKPGGPLEDALQERGYFYQPVKNLRRNISFYDLFALWELIHLIRTHKYDIVHTHSSKTGFLGRVAARLAGCQKVIHTVHGFAIHQYQSKMVNALYSFLEYVAGKFCDKVVFVNNYERQMAINKGLLPLKKIITIYNGIDLDRFSYQSHRDYLNQNYSSSNPFTIGSVLRFSAQKNTYKTILAAIEVCRLNSSIRFVFAGDGGEFRECKRLVEKKRLNSRIHLTGWETEVENLLAKFDVFLLYSRWEGLPISILEAMSSGLPVVASDIKGNNELVDNSNGVLVMLDNQEKLVEVLCSLPLRQQDLINWSRASRLKAENNFGLKQFRNNYRELYDA